MTDIDTASIRAEWGGDTYRYPAGVILDLCDALDAARAEWDREAEVRCTKSCSEMHTFNADCAQSANWPWKARAEAAEENLAFAQQRAADNGLRAEIGERKIADLVSEVHALKARIDAALEVLAEEPDWNQGRNAEVMFFGRDVFEALTGQQ